MIIHKFPLSTVLWRTFIILINHHHPHHHYHYHPYQLTPRHYLPRYFYYMYLPTLEYSTYIYPLVYLLVVHYKGTDTPIYRYTDIRDSLPSHLPYSTLSRTPINSFFLSVTGRDDIPPRATGKQQTAYSTCPVHTCTQHIHPWGQ